MCAAKGSEGTGDTAQVSFLFHPGNASQLLTQGSKMERGLCGLPTPMRNLRIQKSILHKSPVFLLVCISHLKLLVSRSRSHEL